MTTRLAGPICFQDWAGAMSGNEELNAAGFSTMIFDEMVETFSTVVYGAVWLNVDDAQATLDHVNKLADQINELVDQSNGLCDDFGEHGEGDDVGRKGSELTVWGDTSKRRTPVYMW